LLVHYKKKCQLKILQNVEDYRPEILGLLPLNLRRHPLPALPLIDLVALDGTLGREAFEFGNGCKDMYGVK
jgi:hypothetical protein